MEPLNVSTYSFDKTASTNAVCAQQRAQHLFVYNVQKAIELCVGPSLRLLDRTYRKYGIELVGNDIDPRWRDAYPQGKWVIGDARNVDVSPYDAAIVAPPLSRGCSGRREDSLRMDQVFPSFYDFLDLPTRLTVFVLPGRTLSLREDRKELHRFLARLSKTHRVEVAPLRNKVTKYVDVYAVQL